MKTLRWWAAGMAAAAAVALTGCGAPGAGGSKPGAVSQPAKPDKPISLTILDGAGDLNITQAMFENFKKANPGLVSSISYEKANAPDVAGKVKAQQNAGKVSVSMVLGGPDVLGAAVKQNELIKQIPAYASSLPDFGTIFDASRTNYQNLGGGYGVLNRWNPSGPLLEYNPKTVPQPPTTPDALLAWAKAHPGKFSYQRPDNSGPGRNFVQSLPYMLGDSNPSDPANGWSKTWNYLAELGKYIHGYPTSTSIGDQQYGAGQTDIETTQISSDINNRANGTWSPDSQVTTFTNQNWISDGHYMMIPAGVTAQTLYVDLAIEKYILQPDQQALSFTSGNLTPANINVTLAQAPANQQTTTNKWGRVDYYTNAFTQGQTHNPLTPNNLQTMFTLWQQKIGSKVSS